MHAVAEIMGHRWGGSPSHRGGMAGRRTGSCVLPGCCTKAPGEEPGYGAGGHGNPLARQPSRNPAALLGLAGGLLGLLAAAGRRPQGLPRGPRLARLLYPSAQLDPAEKKPQSSCVIFSVNRVSLDLKFKMAQLLSRVLIRKC